MLSSAEQRHIDVSSFTSFVNDFPALLYPAFLAQQRMRTNVIGHRFWRRMTQRRSQCPAVPTVNQLRQLLIRCEHTRRHSPKINAAFHKAKMRVETEHTVTAHCDEGSTCVVEGQPSLHDPTPLTTTSIASYYFPEPDPPVKSSLISCDVGILPVKNASKIVPVTV